MFIINLKLFVVCFLLYCLKTATSLPNNLPFNNILWREVRCYCKITFKLILTLCKSLGTVFSLLPRQAKKWLNIDAHLHVVVPGSCRLGPTTVGQVWLINQRARGGLLGKLSSRPTRSWQCPTTATVFWAGKDWGCLGLSPRQLMKGATTAA